MKHHAKQHMTVNVFFHLYANVPLEKRGIVIDWTDGRTLNDIYRKIKAMEETMRPMRIEQDDMMYNASKFLLEHQACTHDSCHNNACDNCGKNFD